MSTVSQDPPQETPRPTLGQLAALFLRLGATAFGGPAAHIAMMQDEVVERRRWLTREKFLDLLGATNLIPGPNSTEMAIHIGLLAGWSGLLVAGICFILPAVILVTAIAWAYVSYQSLPDLAAVLYGVKPVLIAILLQALIKLGKDSLRTVPLALTAALALTLYFFNVNELLLLAGAGVLMMLVHMLRERGDGGALTAPCVLFGVTLPAAAAPASFSLGAVFLFFLKVGSILYGSGYVLVAFLRSDLVERWGWLTEAELLDAVAVGQVTPGPVFTTATFIGYLLGEKHHAAGLAGAGVATVGIFLPAFVFVALSGPLIPLLRKAKTAAAFLDGVIVASLALMAGVTWDLGQAALVDVWTWGMGIVAALALVVFRVNSTWLIAGGAAVGWLFQYWT